MTTAKMKNKQYSTKLHMIRKVQEKDTQTTFCFLFVLKFTKDANPCDHSELTQKHTQEENKDIGTFAESLYTRGNDQISKFRVKYPLRPDDRSPGEIDPSYPHLIRSRL